MMTTRDAKTLYQDLIVDHGKSPRNEGALAGATHEATTKNPLCGDRVTVRVRVDGGTVREARFEARGCMIARASASLLTEAVAGRSVEGAIDLVRTVDALVAGEPAATDVGVLEPLRGVQEFPARRACVTLAWRALEAALAPVVAARP
jgi:nitrogen fixation NifU-like protein